MTPVGEFAALVGVYAVSVSETEPAEGEILAYWAAMVRDLVPPDVVDAPAAGE